MKKNYKKIAIALCMAACIGSACVGCTTSGNTSEDAETVQNIGEESTSEVQVSNEVIEKEVEIESDSDEKIEFSIDGAAGDVDTQSNNDK